MIGEKYWRFAVGPTAGGALFPWSIQLLHLDQVRIPMYRRAAPWVSGGSGISIPKQKLSAPLQVLNQR